MSLHTESHSFPRKRRRDPLDAADPKRIKRQHPTHQRSQYQDSGPSINVLKSKIRDITRLLNKKIDDLPADVRIAKERELAECHRDLEKAEQKKLRSKMIQKYHFVRFLERKRAHKELKKLQSQKKKLEHDSTVDPDTKESDLEAIDAKIQTTEIDLNYTTYSPLTEKYISLYPNDPRKQEGPQPEESNIIPTKSGEKPPLWYTVKQSMADGTLEQLRDGKLGFGLSGEKKKVQKMTVSESVPRTMDLLVRQKQQKKPDGKGKADKASKSTHKGVDGKKGKKTGQDAKAEDGDDESESDGGFFE